VTSKKSSTGEQQVAKPDLAANYRPVGLKAVAAASLMAKHKPTGVKNPLEAESFKSESCVLSGYMR
jgi:hypothetical protein